jgi:hypothetical protein
VEEKGEEMSDLWMIDQTSDGFEIRIGLE